MKDVNVFGLPLRVGNAAELAESARTADVPTYYVVTRCADLPERLIPLEVRRRNLRTPCEECGEICWYDSVHFVPFTTVVCAVCMVTKRGTENMQAYAADTPLREMLSRHARGERL